jgi:hypothetical protein
MGVNTFILGLVHDLESRCERLFALLSSHQPHPDIEQFHQRVTGNLGHTLRAIKSLQASDQFHREILWEYALADYQDLAHEVTIVEELALPVLLRYNNHDHLSARWVTALLREIGHPEGLMPIVTATSDHYYWAYPELRIIGIPAGDVGGILGWPDVIHESAHILIPEQQELLAGFTQRVDRYFQHQRERLIDMGASQHESRWLSIAQIRWGERQEGTWRVEFAADLVAAYTAGASYAWQHLRLTANHSSAPYDPSPGQLVADHPAAQARLDAVLEMLNLLGLNDDAARIRQRWNDLLKISWGDPRPIGYEQYYPPELLQQLARTIYEGCQRIGLVPWTAQRADSSQSIVQLIDEAWRMFLSNPKTYNAWERQAIARLNKQLAAAPVETTYRSGVAA